MSLLGGATATTSSLENTAWPPSKAIDGDFAGQKSKSSCTSTLISAAEWLRIELAASLPIRTVVHFNNEEDLMISFFYHVGDDPDVSVNPKCQAGAYSDGGIYECALTGKYFGITTATSQRVQVCELRLFSRKTAFPYAVVTGAPAFSAFVSA